MFFKRRNKQFDLIKTIGGCKARKPLAQKELFDYYANYAKNICLRYSANDEEAEEMVSDGFIKVFNNIDRYDSKQVFDAWFRTVMVNAAIDYFRKHHSRVEFTDLSQAYEVENDERYLELMTVDEIMEFVQKLTPVYRTVFSLSVVDGYSHTEIATMLGVTESAVRANLVKARAKLQEWIQAYLSRQSKI
ncbi:RNA polymerase sigma factor [Emticicia sp. BO119]|uniref:RNA polymerase sigma factor n=1 Tax=Emticicia sp. BO119 TaxID=2757768 RepID=UPI0015F009F7|nr:sigma-70 family RNA polymerase sigma factor [Emticicia sp. BO119]MBA4849232.1 sigma-70 family RNA polymerase sigma factor [Emticicia sp. BO119]